jgi:thiol-disulfide isomerase/thioredoxin
LRSESVVYTCNEFSFQDEGTARDWFFNRTPQQKRALKSVWFDMEFTSRGKLFLYSFNLFGKDSGITRVVVSRLAMRRAAELFTSQSGWCDDSMPILEKDAKDAIEKRLPNGVVIEFVD